MGSAWINKDEFPVLGNDQKVVLFGAGQGTVDLLKYLKDEAIGCDIAAVADNDPTMWGQHIQGIRIIDPKEMKALECDKIIITTVSGRDAVAAQLSGMGYLEGRDFFKVGNFPSSAVAGLDALLEFNAVYGFLDRAETALHIGSGGFLGLECGLFALGLTKVTAIDAYSFALQYPNVTKTLHKYENAKRHVLGLSEKYGQKMDQVARRWDSLFIRKNGDVYIDQELIAFQFPHRFSSMPVKDASQDLTASFAVLEHVRDPDKCVQEIKRVLKKGGVSFHRITTRDHRSFSKVEGYTPISYRYYSDEEWARINENKFYQNRLAPFQWKELFYKYGFEVVYYKILERYKISDDEYSKLHKDFSCWPKDRQEEINCIIIAGKP